MFSRALDINLPAGQTAFLWGPRKTGKSTYLKEKFPKSLRYDLLETDLQFRLSKEPHRLREEILAAGAAAAAGPIIIDEVQKVPALLDEIHWLIENAGASFILCGSNARKLRSQAANLLGGRAWSYRMFPLTSHEIPDFDLLRALQRGLIPSHYLSPDPRRSLKAYVFDYVQEEIRAEGLTRNVPAFSRFLDALAFSNGGLVNYANVARDCGVDAKTVKEYYQILSDTLLGHLIPPFSKRAGRDIITAAPRFYCFDTGLAVALAGEAPAALKGPAAGRLFENFILMELMAYRGYSSRDFKVHYWRTKSGLEVDFILDSAVAVEATVSDRVAAADLRGLKAFMEEHRVRRAVLACNEPRARRVPAAGGAVEILPWRKFLDELWSGRLTGLIG